MKKQEGALTVEATIVVLFTLFTIMLMLDFGFVAYHKLLVTKTASEAAADAANVYANLDADPFVGYVDLEDFRKRRLYRHLNFTTLLPGKFHKDTKMDKEVKEKAKWYACYRIKSNEAIPSKSTYDDVNAELTKDGDLGKLQLKVSIKREYQVLSLGVFNLFGLDNTYTCEGVGYAECVDTIDYINLVNMNKEFSETYFEEINGYIDQIVNIILNLKEICS